MGLQVVILAAGSGKRMVSQIPKVLHKIGGVAMLERVVRTAHQLKPDNIHVVHGNGGDKVCEALQYLKVHWVKQDEQLGTGHAVMQALPYFEETDKVLVLYGDVPLISEKTLNHLLQDTPVNGLGQVVTDLQDPAGFGRIVRNEVGNITSIVEHKDASEAQLKIHEINTGILLAQAKNLKSWLPRLKNQNKQNEYYLTDIVSLAVEDGVPVGGVKAASFEEVQGVNDRWQQAQLERYYQLTEAKRLAYLGVTFIDPNHINVRGEVIVGGDVIVEPNVIFEGRVEIGNGCYIGPNVILKDVKLGDFVNVLANTVIESSVIGDHCSIGPFARIRPGTEMKEYVHIGNFVEVKKTHLGKNTKASHLTYLGDADIGENVNIGAGTITCNYDGVNKHKTEIDNNASIGANTSLVAPVRVGEGATIGAGSVLSKDAPAHKLTITRAIQKTIEHWQRPKKDK